MNGNLPQGVTDTFDGLCKWCGKIVHVEQGHLLYHTCRIEVAK